MKKSLLIGSLFLMALSAQAQNTPAPQAQGDLPGVETVQSVDVTRYMGLWHQIAFYPSWFQKTCTVNTTATYELEQDGSVSVFNECYKPNGKYKSIRGYATVADKATNAKLKVKFFWFAPAGDYWIIDLGQNYEYAVVGSPNRKYLWILSRTPSISKALYDSLLKKAEAQGFDTTRLVLTSTLAE